MGNACTNIKVKIPQSKANIICKKFRRPSKTFQLGSKLNIQIQKWIHQILPNLREQSQIKKYKLNIEHQGLLIYENQDQLVFNRKKQSNNQNSNQFSQNQETKDKLIVNVSKDSKGFKIEFKNDFVYELVIQPRNIEQDSKILIGGTQYKLIKFIKDINSIKNQIRSMNKIKDGRIPTTQFIQSFRQLGGNQNQKPTCRICMNQQLNNQNPLISPCDCIGSVKYFHLKCWTEWACHTQYITPEIYSGYVKKQKCQICKKSLIQNQLYRETIAALLSSANKIKTPFAVLEGIKSMKDFPYYKNIQVNYIIISFAYKNQYSLGRGIEADIKSMPDKLISRLNSVLRMENQMLFIEDHNSKHGTYIKVQRPINIDNDVSKSFLYKNSLFNVKID